MHTNPRKQRRAFYRELNSLAAGGRVVTEA